VEHFYLEGYNHLQSFSVSTPQLTVFEKTSSSCEVDGDHHEVSYPFALVNPFPFIPWLFVWEMTVPSIIIHLGSAIDSH
jgi:hypothetical protein